VIGELYLVSGGNPVNVDWKYSPTARFSLHILTLVTGLPFPAEIFVASGEFQLKNGQG